jgi:hypothetical protein
MGSEHSLKVKSALNPSTTTQHINIIMGVAALLLACRCGRCAWPRRSSRPVTCHGIASQTQDGGTELPACSRSGAALVWYWYVRPTVVNSVARGCRRSQSSSSHGPMHGDGHGQTDRQTRPAGEHMHELIERDDGIRCRRGRTSAHATTTTTKPPRN